MNIKTDRMIKKAIFLLTATVLFAVQSCKTDDKGNTDPIPGMKEVDLTEYGLNLSIQTPDESKGKVDIVVQSIGATEIKVGKGFQVSIKLEDGDIAEKKADIANDDANKFKRYVIDEPTTIMWESQMADLPQFHFYTIIKVGTATYVVEDIKDEQFSETAIKTMYESAKAIKAKAPAAKS